MSTAVETRISPSEYLEIERKSEFRSEYIDGAIYPMAGASREHNKIAGGIYANILSAFEGRTAEVYISDMRVLVDPEGLYTYPDVVAAVEPRFLDGAFDTLLNPSVIVEVLSPSTEAEDRGPKFARYRRLESLREYVLVAQDRISVECFQRSGERWVLTVAERLDATLRLESIEVEIPIAAIYTLTPLGDGTGHTVRK